MDAMTKLEQQAREAVKSAFRVTLEDGGIMFRWSDDPLDFIWQTNEQAANLVINIIQKFGEMP